MIAVLVIEDKENLKKSLLLNLYFDLFV